MRAAYTRSGKPIFPLFVILPVFFYLILIGIGYYVYVISLCVQLIRHDRIALGVVLVVIYHISLLIMLWAYIMVILTDPGRVIPEHQALPAPPPLQQQQQYPSGQVEAQGEPQQELPPMARHSIEAHIKQAQAAKEGEPIAQEPAGVMIPGAQGLSRSGYIHISEDPSAQAHPLWCSKCEHVKTVRAHHCRVCKRCVLKMDHHCPWVLNCVGQDNYKFFVLFIGYTAIHCLYVLISMIPLYLRYPDETWTHQVQVIGMVIAGVFGLTLVVFTMTHIRLILLNRTTIEDHLTPFDEGILPCFRKGWRQSEGVINQGNERLYDLSYKENWEQAMGKGWKCLIPVRFPRPEGPIYNQKVVARQWRDYYQQLEIQKQQQAQQVPQQPEESSAIGTARPTPIEQDMHYRPNSSASTP